MRRFHSTIRHPQSAIRQGVTLTEVLISIGILTVGLLGAAAMFPVGGHLMRRGEVADRGSAIAQAAFADLVARGQLSPEKWGIWVQGTGYAPMGTAMRSWMADETLSTGRNDEVSFQQKMNTDIGFIYMIDPLGCSEGARRGLNSRQIARAPFNAQPQMGSDGVPGMTDIGGVVAWQPFMDGWPVRRLSSTATDIGGVPLLPVAEQIFSSSDDLSFAIDDAEKPTQQRLIGPDTTGDGRPNMPIRRESRGHYTWMATIAPSQNDAREALALNPSAYYYDVSVVVFYRRPISTMETSERLVGGNVISTGTGGGEILLTKLADGINVSPFEDLKQGQWVMVSGPHPNSTDLEPLFFTQWYRVLAIDEELRGPIVDPAKQRLVGLRGPDWPWGPGAPVRVGLFPGAVAVHTKTMRLDTLGPFTN